jgi:hypothetical protein
VFDADFCAASGFDRKPSRAAQQAEFDYRIKEVRALQEQG